MIKYQPYKTTPKGLETLCTMTYDTEEDALKYTRKRGLNDSEVVLKELFYEEEYIREF